MEQFFIAAGHLAYEYGPQIITCLLLIGAAALVSASVREREE